jgi:uncharacterized membrane protein
MSSLYLNFIAGIVVLTTVFFVGWIKRQKTPWIQVLLDWFPAILFAYVIPAAFTHLGEIDLSKTIFHDLSKNWIIPITILTVMSALSIKELKIVGVKPIFLFVFGSLIIAITPIFLVLISGNFSSDIFDMFIAEAYWKGLAPIVGGWIGGSTSQLILKELAETPEELFLSILVLDNILVNIWTILMFQFIKKSFHLNKIWGIDQNINLVTARKYDYKYPRYIRNLITLGVISTTIILSSFLQLSFLESIVALSLLGLLYGNTIKHWNHQLVLQLSGFLIVLIMAILGLKLNFTNLSLPFSLIVLVIIWLLVHFVAMIVMARFLKINIAWVAIGSMANLGGISTAPAVTSAYKKELMPHAIILAILSMVTGTAWGMLTIYLFQNWF